MDDEALMEIGWPQTDSLVSDSCDIKSTTAAYHLFSQGTQRATVLLAVSYLSYEDKKTHKKEQAWYGIYWTPEGEENPFRVYHCKKTERWLTEHGSDSLPVYVCMNKKSVNSKDVYDPTFFNMSLAAEEWMWKNMIPQVWKEIWDKEAKEYPQ
jgi:hypothetical protein